MHILSGEVFIKKPANLFLLQRVFFMIPAFRNFLSRALFLVTVDTRLLTRDYLRAGQISTQYNSMHEHCPHCGKESADESPLFCSGCGARMDGTGPSGLPGFPVPGNERKNSSIAGFCSSCIPGLGQVYNGQTIKGFVIFLVALAGLCLFLIPGFLVWLYAMYDAYAVAGKMNTSEIEFKEMRLLHMILFIVFAAIAIVVLIVGITLILVASLTPSLGVIGAGDYSWMFTKYGKI